MVDKYRVVTFQSKEVIDILRSKGEYFASKNKAREGSFDDKDIQNCNGNIPIWVFQHPAFRLDTVGIKQFCNMLQTFTEEMSIDTLDGLYMVELYSTNKPIKGIAHNDSSIACVIPSIKLEDVVCIYKVLCTSECIYNFYDLIPIQVNPEHAPLFPNGFKSSLELYTQDEYPILSLSDFKSADDYYVYKKVMHAYLCSTLNNDYLVNKAKLKVSIMLMNGELTLEQLHDYLCHLTDGE